MTTEPRQPKDWEARLAKDLQAAITSESCFICREEMQRVQDTMSAYIIQVEAADVPLVVYRCLRFVYDCGRSRGAYESGEN